MGEDDMIPEHPDPGKYWTHRRRGFFIGLWWAVVQTFLWVAVGIYSVDVLEALGVVIGWSYGISATTTVSYYGGNAFETMVMRPK